MFPLGMLILKIEWKKRDWASLGTSIFMASRLTKRFLVKPTWKKYDLDNARGSKSARNASTVEKLANIAAHRSTELGFDRAAAFLGPSYEGTESRAPASANG